MSHKGYQYCFEANSLEKPNVLFYTRHVHLVFIEQLIMTMNIWNNKMIAVSAQCMKEPMNNTKG